MTEILLLVVIALLTVNILLVGVYIVLVLKEVRAAVIKMNQILDSFSAVSTAITNPIVGVTGAASGFAEVVKSVQKLKKIVKGRKKEEEDEPEQ